MVFDALLDETEVFIEDYGSGIYAVPVTSGHHCVLMSHFHGILHFFGCQHIHFAREKELLI